MKGDKILLPILVKFVLNTLKQIRDAHFFHWIFLPVPFYGKPNPQHI